MTFGEHVVERVDEILDVFIGDDDGGRMRMISPCCR